MPLDPERRKQLQERLEALQRIQIFQDLNPNNEADLIEMDEERYAMLEIDGGGFHVTYTLELLMRLEQEAGLPCYRLFDLLTGSSAGAFTVALMNSGMTAKELSDFWDGEATELFPYRDPWVGDYLKFLRNTGQNFWEFYTRNTLLTFRGDPLIDKKPFRDFCRRHFGDRRFKEAVQPGRAGMLLMTKDVKSGYILPLGTVPLPGGRYAGVMNSSDLLIRAVMEGAGSAPGIWQPLAHYIDGGFGVFNSPDMLVLATLAHLRSDHFPRSMELMNGDRSIREAYEKKYVSIPEKFYKEENAYKIALMSFGTAISSAELMPTSIAMNPAASSYLWMLYLVSEEVNDTSMSQDWFLSSPQLAPWLDFRRNDLSFSDSVFKSALQLGPFSEHFGKIPGISGQSTTTVTSEDVYWMLWPLDPDYSPFFRALGRSTLRFMEAHNLPGQLFYHGAARLLRNFDPNMPNPKTEPWSQDKFSASLAATLGSVDWLERQPTGKSIAQTLAPSVYSMVPPFFQKDNPMVPNPAEDS